MATLSQNVAQAISDLGAVKTAIENKGVTVPANTPTSQYGSLIGDIPVGDNTALKKLIEGTATSFTVPDGVTKIYKYTFQDKTALTSVILPSSLTSIEYYAFSGCTGLTSVTIPDSVTAIVYRAFSGCSSLTSLTLPNNNVSTYYIDSWAFSGCGLTSLSIPSSVSSLSQGVFAANYSLSTLSLPGTAINFNTSTNPFYSCSALENVTLGSGFNGQGLNLSVSTLYTEATIVGWLNALLDRTGQAARTLTMGATNLAKLTAEEIAIATNKNWNLA